MRRKEFIDIILDSISEKFDIYHNYRFNGYKFVIYAYCYDRRNKFENAPKEARLWETKTYEHLFFINQDNLTLDTLDKLQSLTMNDIEPHFVRGDGKSPAKQHMYSYISFIIITRNKPSAEVEEAIRKINFTKSYMFSTRGYSSMRIACVTPREYNVVCNKAGKDIADFLNNIMLRINLSE